MATGSPTIPTSGPDSVQMARYDEWFSGKAFTTDWTSSRFPIWETVFAERQNSILKILEIGSWEGRSAIFFLNFFPACTLTCVDAFEVTSRDRSDPTLKERVSGAERRFDANVAEFGARLRKLKCLSHEGLAQLGIEREAFDLIYVDASHHSHDVYVDAVLSWPLLSGGGIMIFDDYRWRQLADDPGPKVGIDAFVETNAGGYRELYRRSQVIIEKNR
jgi:predicted O-methyltransferase YrrM